jgi:hypothetical protein
VRLASSGDPELALIRAQQSIEATMRNNHAPCYSQLVSAETSVKQSQIEALLPYGGQVAGVVDITTDVEVTPLVLGWCLGNKRQLSFRSRQELPITYVVPNVLANAGKER